MSILLPSLFAMPACLSIFSWYAAFSRAPHYSCPPRLRPATRDTRVCLFIHAATRLCVDFHAPRCWCLLAQQRRAAARWVSTRYMSSRRWALDARARCLWAALLITARSAESAAARWFYIKRRDIAEFWSVYIDGAPFYYVGAPRSVYACLFYYAMLAFADDAEKTLMFYHVMRSACLTTMLLRRQIAARVTVPPWLACHVHVAAFTRLMFYFIPCARAAAASLFYRA